MPFLFEKLDVYQKAVDLAETVSKLTDTFPKGNYYLIDQLNRVVLSISCHLAKGDGHKHADDRKPFFWAARTSAQECVPVLEVCRRKSLILPNQHEELKSALDTVIKMIYGLVKGLDKLENEKKN